MTPADEKGVSAQTAERPIRWHIAAIVGACLVVYFVGLSWRSFALSEGHRVAPAWEMLRTGDWWHVRMFETTYLRKPPGMPWAIAAMSSLFGETEFAARSVSALSMTLSALAAWWFAGRWFGTRAALASGLGLALMPQMWAVGRSTEIEALHNLGVLLACFAAADVAMRGWERARGLPRSETDAGREADGEGIAGRIGPAPETTPAPRARPTRSGLDTVLVLALGAVGVVVAAMAKGPAGAPALAGVLIAAAGLRMWSARSIGCLAGMLLAGGAIATALLWRWWRINDDPGAIRQGPSEFLWSGGAGIGGVVMLAPMALFAALPTSLAFMFPWGPDARAEAERAGPEDRRAWTAARLMAWSWIGALGVSMAVGIHNPRYALPAAALLAPLAAYVVRGVWGSETKDGTPLFDPKRRALAEKFLLRRPAAVPVILACVALLSTAAMRGVKVGSDGRDAGIALARLAGPGAVVWADGLIEARPDVLLYARREAERRGETLRPLWKKHAMSAGELPPAGARLVLRVDEEGDERPRYEAAILDGRIASLGDGDVGRYRFRVFEVR